jgi:predicted MFS family arabinose efflux permease
MIFSTSIAILTSVFPPGERGRALGINIATIYLGLSLGPVLGGILTQHFGWKSIFMIILPLAMPSVFLIHWKVKEEWAESQGERFDLTGSLIYCVSLLSLMYGLSVIPAIRGLWLILALELAVSPSSSGGN